MIPIETFIERRRRLAEAMGGGIAILPTAPERVRNRDAHYPYRFDSYFYYWTGFREPAAVLVVGGTPLRSILFCREKDPEREIWDGYRYGPEAARAAFRIASRKRDEGAISQVEFIDARSSLTGAELNLNVTRFQVLARQAELDFATAAGSLPLSGTAHQFKDRS